MDTMFSRDVSRCWCHLLPPPPSASSGTLVLYLSGINARLFGARTAWSVEWQLRDEGLTLWWTDCPRPSAEGKRSRLVCGLFALGLQQRLLSTTGGESEKREEDVFCFHWKLRFSLLISTLYMGWGGGGYCLVLSRHCPVRWVRFVHDWGYALHGLSGQMNKSSVPIGLSQRVWPPPQNKKKWETGRFSGQCKILVQHSA